MSIETLCKPILIRVSLCLEGRQGIFLLIFFFYLRYSKLICKFRHEFFINLWFQQKSNLQPSALFLKNLRSAAGKFTHSAICDSTYAPIPYSEPYQYGAFCSEPCVTLAYLETCHNLRYIQNNVKHLYRNIYNTVKNLSWNTLFETFYNPDMLRTLVYSQFWYILKSQRILSPSKPCVTIANLNNQ